MRHPPIVFLLLKNTLGIINFKLYLIVINKCAKATAIATEILLIVFTNYKLLGNIGIVDIEYDPLLKLLLKSEKSLVDRIVKNDLYNILGGKTVVNVIIFIALVAKNDLVFMNDYSFTNI